MSTHRIDETGDAIAGAPLDGPSPAVTEALDRARIADVVWTSQVAVAAIVDREWRLESVSPHLASVFVGSDAARAAGGSLVGQPATILVAPLQAPALSVALLAAGPAWSQHRFGLAGDAGGVPVDFRVSLQKVGDVVVLVGEPEVANRSAFDKALLEMTDDLLAEQRTLTSDRARLHQLSTTDQLTTLGNRRLLEESLPGLMAAARAAGEPLGIVFADIDHFKSVNDVYGHAAGDQVLAFLASMLRNESRAGDLVCRFGGEEFVVLLPRCDIGVVVRWAERARTRLASTVAPGVGSAVTASFGVAVLREDETAQDLLTRADAALYAAKDAGRNRVVAADGGAESTDGVAIVLDVPVLDRWAGLSEVLWSSTGIGAAEFDEHDRLMASNRGFERLVGDSRIGSTPGDLVVPEQRAVLRALAGEARPAWTSAVLGFAANETDVPVDRLIWLRRVGGRIQMIVEVDSEVVDRAVTPLLELVDDLVTTQRELTIRNRELQKAIEALETARTEVRKLRQVVPVCAWCRRIRVFQDGVETWVSLETYLSLDEGSVTHGICDRCAAEVS